MQGRDVILGLLIDMPRTGYEINEMFQDIFYHFFSGGYGMIYPTLRKLEAEGKVRKEVVVQEGKPNKHVYHATEAGEQAFNDYLRTDIDRDIFHSEFLMRLYFGRHVASEQLNQWIRDELGRVERLKKQMQTEGEKWDRGMTQSQHLAYEFGMAMYQAQINVLRRRLEEDDPDD